MLLDFASEKRLASPSLIWSLSAMISALPMRSVNGIHTTPSESLCSLTSDCDELDMCDGGSCVHSQRDCAINEGICYPVKYINIFFY